MKYYAVDRKNYTETHFFSCNEDLKKSDAIRLYADSINEDIQNFSFFREATEYEKQTEKFDTI